MGELRLGRDYTATFWNWTVFDPFGTNGVGASSNLGLGFNAQALGQVSGGYATLVRASNMVAYILPNGTFGPGLYGEVQVAAGENTPGSKYYGGRIGYAAGPFNVAAAYGKTEVTTGGSVDLDNWNIAGSWDFGMAKLSGFYGQLKLKGAPFNADQDNWYIGVTAPLGQYNLKASYGSVSRSSSIAAIDSQKANQWAIGADYNLSKRTALYATWSSINNTDTNFAVATTSPLSLNHNSTGGEIGVKHSF